MFILKFVGYTEQKDSFEKVVEADEISIVHKEAGLTKLEVVRQVSQTIRTSNMYFLSNAEDAPTPTFQSLFIMNQDGKTIETLRATK